MNMDRHYLNYICIEHAHLSDDECTRLVSEKKAQAATKFNQKRQVLHQAQKDKAKQWPINTKCDTWRGGLIRKIVAQWNDLANQGKVKNRRLEACRSYCEKQTGVSRLEWFTTHDFNKVIEGLKAWQNRTH